MGWLKTLALLGALLICASSPRAAQCVIEGEYLRKDGARILVSAAMESLGDPMRANVHLRAHGSVAPDGAPRYGNLEGELHLSRDHCTGVVVGEISDCKIVIHFTRRIASVSQVGTCFSGTGVSGDGDYVRQKAPGSRNQGRHSAAD